MKGCRIKCTALYETGALNATRFQLFLYTWLLRIRRKRIWLYHWYSQNCGATSLITIFNLLIYLFSEQLSNFKKRGNTSAIIGAQIFVLARHPDDSWELFSSQSRGQARGSRLIEGPKIIPIEEVISDDAEWVLGPNFKGWLPSLSSINRSHLQCKIHLLGQHTYGGWPLRSRRLGIGHLFIR